MSAIYTGPQCPSCNAALNPDVLRTGSMRCPYCRLDFEGTPFQPRDWRHETVQVVMETPEGVTAACANHARNAAVTSCTRCGLFICSLCDMNVGEGSVCPACFGRAQDRTEAGGGATRYRDYASMSTSAALFGLLSCGFFPGLFAIVWGVKAVKQRRTEGLGVAGPVIAIIAGVVESGWLIFFIAITVIGMVKGTT